MHRRIGELRGDHDVTRAADGARQALVLVLIAGVCEEDIDRDYFRLGGGQRVDGAGDHLARPGKAPVASHADFIDGHDRDVFGNRQRSAKTHQPVPRVTADAARLPIDQNPGGGGHQ